MLRQRKANQTVTDNVEVKQEGKNIKPSINKGSPKETPPSKLKVWILASRPHTLTASIVPVLVSAAFISHYKSSSSSSLIFPSSSETSETYSHYYLSFFFATFACLIQLGTNLHNDYSDFVKGADTDERVGQARATQKGWLTPFETAFGSTLCLGIASILGFYLTWIATSSTKSNIDYYMLFVTLSSVFNAFCYTGGEYPLGYIGLGHLSIGYSGLGDLFVFLYFGLVATITVPYLYLVQINYDLNHGNINMNIWGHDVMVKSFILALPIGFLATAIIAVNNLRDRRTDVVAGKKTMAVRFGEWFTRFEYIFLVIGSYLMLIPLSNILWLNDDESNNMKQYWLFLPLLSFPLAWKELKAVGFGGKDGSALNPHVGGVAKVQLVYCIFLIIGMNLSRL